MLRVNLLISLLFFVTISCGQNNQQNVNRNYNIVLGEKYKSKNLEASKILLSYLNNNVKLLDTSNKAINAIEISTVDNLKPCEFIIQNKNGVISFQGGNEKGTLYAVSTFIEDELKVKWYTYQDKTEGLESIIIKPNYYKRSTPSFEFRSIYSNDFLQHTDYADFHKINYAFEGRKLYAHSFDDFVSPQKYFNSHPEYFAEVNGKRIKDQLCLSKPEVYEIVKNELAQKIKQNPEIKNWSFSQNDNRHVCQCNLCRSKITNDNDFSEILIPFVNKLASDYPNVTISTLAFNQSMKPPKRVIPRKNIEIMFCIADYDRFYSFGEAKDEKSVITYNAFKKWSQVSDNIFIWDYTVNFFNTISPFPNIQTFQKTLKKFSDYKVKGVFMQGVGEQVGEFAELKSYLLSKMLWNVNVDSEVVTKEFMKNYYGPGWENLYLYLTVVYQNNKGKFFLSNWEDYNTASFDTYKNYENYKAFFTKALSAAKTEEQQKRITKELLSLQYNYIENAKLSKFKNGKLSHIISEFKKNSKFVNLDFVRYKDYKVVDYLKSFE
ncbi:MULTISPECIES: DUF4838 domain-containing protein [unclassified Empedobacter]|uniref:DUF4838 domain-containing protein n=1 Tax=unclassified Empedobacter TaxID=2643773 RepID=UPI0025B8E5D7|nr:MULTISPECIES: DUF4838 domain-containing protein [unclassified Empedobacter]